METGVIVYRQNKNKQRVEPKRDKLGVLPTHTLIPILTKFGMWGGLPDMFLKFEFQDDCSINVGAVGGRNLPSLPLTRLIAYTTACCYRTSRDKVLYKHQIMQNAHVRVLLSRREIMYDRLLQVPPST